MWSGRLHGSPGVIFNISPTLNQTQCCADPPPSFKCNNHCMMKPCYAFLASCLLPLHYHCPSQMHSILLYLILEQSQRTHKKCSSFSVTEPKDSPVIYPCCLGTYWNAIIFCVWCSLSYMVYGKSMQYTQTSTLEKYFQTSFKGHCLVISITLNLGLDFTCIHKK